ncbi:MAG TPA: response regulator [Chthoniobacter sp.]|nr:response regulator [Chthoniobacter sp.]
MKKTAIKFLLVDDLDSNLLALEGLLRRDGLELLRARSGTEALELLLIHEVALALVDVQMPGMDGFELAELMRGTERTRHVPIIFVTAGAVDQQRRFRGYEAGAVDFIFKPIEPHILQSKSGIFFELAEQREALRRSAEEAQAANRAKDEFLAALSHELRTPLNPVLMTAASLEKDMSLSQDVRDQLSMMRRNVELETRLIDDLLDITRISRGKLTVAAVSSDLHQLLRETVDIVRNGDPSRSIAVVFTLDAESHYARVDPARIQQVFWNLIKNAFKFSTANGTVTVHTRNEGTDKIVISVEDTGVGISADALPRIFKAFDQGDNAGNHRYGGLGLGLTISKAIVEAHGGSIQAQSDGLNKGATFTLALATTAAPEAEPSPGPKPPSPAGGLRVLIVEDHEATNTVLARLLTRGGHQVTLSACIQQALQALGANTFDVVISDLGLPDGSGIDLMREIRETYPAMVGIALSGYGMETDLQKSKAAGFYAHLVKPIDIDRLRSLLDEIAVSLPQ